jgi:ubiquinone/menaquinone biosynthesis C-methylase UbiE
MATTALGVRVFGGKRAIDYADTLAFFERRAKHAGITATMYQQPELAYQRDHAEKQAVLATLNVRTVDRVLDIGCGTGRWAEVLAPHVSAYLGIDFSAGLLETARARVPSAVFQCADISSLDSGALAVAPPFTLFVCSGILTYLNDTDVQRLFSTISRVAGPDSRLYLREPTGKHQRLTLDGYWSEELEAVYSAIYRTRDEYIDLFKNLSRFELIQEGEPFPRKLQNRTETEQRFFILQRIAL